MKKKELFTMAMLTAMTVFLMACGTDTADSGTYTVSVEKIENPMQAQEVETQAAEAPSTEKAEEEQSASDKDSAIDTAIYNQIQEETKNYTGQSGDEQNQYKDTIRCLFFHQNLQIQRLEMRFRILIKQKRIWRRKIFRIMQMRPPT